METLIDQIYESAFIPDQWPGVLDQLARVSDSAGGSLFVHGPDFTLLTATPDARQRAELALKARLPQQNRGLSRALASRHAGFLTEQDLFSSAELEHDPMAEFWKRLGIGSAIITTFQLPTDETLVLLLTRSVERGTPSRGILDQLDGLRPHIGRAAYLSARLQLERARLVGDTLAALGLPALVFSENAKVMAANHLAEQLQNFISWRPQDRMALTNDVANRMLVNALQSINSAEGSVRSFPVRDAIGQSAMIAHVIPVRLSARDVFVRCNAVLVLTPVTTSNAAPAEIIQSLFELTPSEARVARGLASGLSIDDIAGQGSVSRNTVRAQLRGVMDKTGCTRQAEVVALLSGISPFPSAAPTNGNGGARALRKS